MSLIRKHVAVLQAWACLDLVIIIIHAVSLSTSLHFCCSFLGGITAGAQAIPPIPTRFSVAWSVCLSSVRHIRASCLNRSTDLDAIWQVHLWGPMTHCVRWGP